ncbi:MAG: cytochrome b/b6 domain-containing protein [Gammaproteobacteria bacterium]|nr:cytochrome b/b6 domain-containing protein [Gammaproteobacteria bacterium]
MNRSYVWDLPTRIFHWLLVVLVSLSLYTGFVGGFEEMDWHMYSGYAILTLILFRLAWGVFGSYNARFTTFVRGPGAIMAYVRSLRSSPPGVGHSPLGGVSVLAILLAICVQAATGLFATDDIFIEGPLVHLVSDDMSGELTRIHNLNRWIIIALIGLHLTAIAFYQLIKTGRPVVSDDYGMEEERRRTRSAKST